MKKRLFLICLFGVSLQSSFLLASARYKIDALTLGPVDAENHQLSYKYRRSEWRKLVSSKDLIRFRDGEKVLFLKAIKETNSLIGSKWDLFSELDRVKEPETLSDLASSCLRLLYMQEALLPFKHLSSSDINKNDRRRKALNIKLLDLRRCMELVL